VQKPMRPCPEPGCPNLTTMPKGCSRHRAEAAQATPYDGAWTAFAAAYLSRHPRCERCGVRPSREAHHIRSVALAPHRRLDPTNVIALCHTCHRAVTPTVRADAGANRRRTR